MLSVFGDGQLLISARVVTVCFVCGFLTAELVAGQLTAGQLFDLVPDRYRNTAGSGPELKRAAVQKEEGMNED